MVFKLINMHVRKMMQIKINVVFITLYICFFVDLVPVMKENTKM